MWWHLSTDLRKGRKEMWGSWGKALQAEGTVSAQPTRQERSIFPQEQTRLEWMQKTGRWWGPCGARQTALVRLYQVFLLFCMKQESLEGSEQKRDKIRQISSGSSSCCALSVEAADQQNWQQQSLWEILGSWALAGGRRGQIPGTFCWWRRCSFMDGPAFSPEHASPYSCCTRVFTP